MRTWIRTRWLAGWLIGSLAFAACTAETSTTGDLAIELELLDGTRIDEVTWVIRRVGMEPMAGIVNTSAPAATASVEVFGIPPAEGYTVSMTATSADGETSCSGFAEFDVALGAVTEVTVMLNCKQGRELGGVRIDGTLNICADLAKVVVAPLQTSVGSQFRVSSRAEDAESDAIRYRWAGTGGSFANPNAPETTYTCRELGQQTITITVSDDGFEYCDRNWNVDINCVDGGSGGTGGTSGTGGTGGTGGTRACGAGESIDPSFTSNVGSVICDALGVITIPIEVVLAAKPKVDIDGLTDFDVQAQATLDEDVVNVLGGLVQTAVIGESSTEVEDSEGSGSVNVPATVPCTIDLSEDPDDNGRPGPIVITTPLRAAAWTEVDGTVVLEAVDMTFAIAQPVPITLSTKGPNPDCAWLSIPRVTFQSGAGGGPGAEEKELSLGCSNSSPIGAQTILSALLKVDPSPISASSEFDAELSGSANFPESFLDAAQVLVVGGLRQVTLRDLQYIAQVRSGATLVSGSADVPGVPLGPDASMLNPGLVRLCNFPSDQTCTENSDCAGTICNQPVIMIDVPTSQDCAPGGFCDALGKADGAESQCGLNGFCVTGPLEIPLLPVTATYTAEASGDVLFGWADQGLDNSTFDPMTQLFTIPKSASRAPVEQGVSVEAGLVVSIECVMGVDAGSDPSDGGNSLVGLTPDEALISFAIAE